MAAASTPSHSFFSDFPKAFSTLLSEVGCKQIFASHGPRGAGRPKLSPWQWIMARVYHELARSGTFSANVKTITRVTISDSALSQRAFSIGWKLIDEILATGLHAFLTQFLDRVSDLGAGISRDFLVPMAA